MPGERRTLRSNKESASTNGEKARSDSQSSASTKDKPLPARATSSKSKAGLVKKGISGNSAKDMAGDKPKTNGAEPVENGLNSSEDVEMEDDGAGKSRPNGTKEGEDEMTVVVPPPNSSKLSGQPVKEVEVDVDMDEVQHPPNGDIQGADHVDPKVKATSGKCKEVVLQRACTVLF